MSLLMILKRKKFKFFKFFHFSHFIKLTKDATRNACHGSDSNESAQRVRDFQTFKLFSYKSVTPFPSRISYPDQSDAMLP